MESKLKHSEPRTNLDISFVGSLSTDQPEHILARSWALLLVTVVSTIVSTIAFGRLVHTAHVVAL